MVKQLGCVRWLDHRYITYVSMARRITSKAILAVTRSDLEEAAGSLRLCAGQVAGIEAAIHAMRESFNNEGTEAVLLVDACNAFNSLINREVTLLNIRYICPTLATVHINIYRNSTELVVNRHFLSSEEGPAQGDPLAMPMHALALVLLIRQLRDNMSEIVQQSSGISLRILGLLLDTMPIPRNPGSL